MNILKTPEASTDALDEWGKWILGLAIALFLAVPALGLAMFGANAASRIPFVGAFFDAGSGGDGSGAQSDQFGVPHFN